ncbi:MAG TPA: cyclic nucleotide-binding domain-containing protein [Terriglobia bacterium]|nr:cyclic nucleotide-binding domain-containing protein [Terriglobia bacterium]
MPIAVSRLESFELFAGLSQQELGFVAQNCEEKTFPGGATLIQQGQVGKEVYLLEQGRVRVSRGSSGGHVHVATLDAPTVLGEMASLDPDQIRTATVEALTDLRLLSIPIRTFHVLLGVYPVLKANLKQLVSKRGGLVT